MSKYREMLDKLDRCIIIVKDEEQAIQIQNKLFELGFVWEHSNKRICHTDAKYYSLYSSLYDSRNIINYGITDLCYEEIDRQITFEELMTIKIDE